MGRRVWRGETTINSFYIPMVYKFYFWFSTFSLNSNYFKNLKASKQTWGILLKREPGCKKSGARDVRKSSPLAWVYREGEVFWPGNKVVWLRLSITSAENSRVYFNCLYEHVTAARSISLEGRFPGGLCCHLQKLCFTPSNGWWSCSWSIYDNKPGGGAGEHKKI